MTQTKNTTARNFNSVFDELLHAFPYAAREVKSYNGPAVNIFENSNDYQLEINAPGRNKEDFKIELENTLLTISYEHKNETESRKAIRKEYSIKSFKRSFTIDEKINADGIQAKYEAGILTLTLPKREEVKNMPKQIVVG